MPLHRRSLVPDHPGDCHSWYEHGCSSPPSPPDILHPTASPSPSPSPSSPSWLPCPPTPGLAPSPSPVHGAAGGRRDQGGTRGGGGADDHHHRFVTFIFIAAAALAFLSLILFGVSVAVRRRWRRRRRALLAPAPDAVANVEDGGNDDPEGVGGVVHHVWYIRTVGLDEAAINSIAVTRYRAGAGLLGATDCSVCLGKFQDGELVRLLPKCGHAFHVPCIDTWLRAHVNCPLCRSDVLDSAATAAASGGQSNSNPPVDPDANAAAEHVAAASDSILEHEEENDQEAPPAEGGQHEQLSSPDPLPQQLPCPLPRNVRRAASMDAAIVSAAADVAALLRLPEGAPEEEQSGRQKLGTGASCVKVSGSGHLSSLSTEWPASGGVPRSFFSRHCRARSSVLPL